MRTTLLTLLGLFFVVLSTPSYSAVIGNITYDGTSNYVTDSNGRMYSKLDATIGMTYAQLQTEFVTSGSEWYGWSIATTTESDDFINALLTTTSNPCDGDSSFAGTNCGTISGWSDGIIGNSSSPTEDYWIYADVLNGPDVAGFGYISYRGGLADYGNEGDLAFADYEAQYDYMGYLLYKNATVPEPASLALLGIGLVGLGISRKRKHKA